MPVRAIRGAITVENNDAADMIDGTRLLLSRMVEENKIDKEDIISVIFSVTQDLNAAFPAGAARQMGWTDIALMCTHEISVPGSLEKCIRIMMHINSEKRNAELRHVYLGGAKILRPDIAG